MKKYEVTADELNVRSGPGANYPRLGTVLNSAALDSPEIEGWVPVIYNGNIGWCSAAHLKELQEEQEEIVKGLKPQKSPPQRRV